jgi:hypothetical protein
VDQRRSGGVAVFVDEPGRRKVTRRFETGCMRLVDFASAISMRCGISARWTDHASVASYNAVHGAMSERHAEPADDESWTPRPGFVTNNFYAPVNAERAVFGTLGALPRHTEKNQGGISDTEILRTADRYVDPPIFQAAVARLEQEHRHPVRAGGQRQAGRGDHAAPGR